MAEELSIPAAIHQRRPKTNGRIQSASTRPHASLRSQNHKGAKHIPFSLHPRKQKRPPTRDPLPNLSSPPFIYSLSKRYIMKQSTAEYQSRVKHIQSKAIPNYATFPHQQALTLDHRLVEGIVGSTDFPTVSQQLKNFASLMELLKK